jgi:cell division protein FtsZ
MTYFQPEIQANRNNLIKVIGVGGGGSNAVNYMFKHGIEGVDFFICNTDVQALNSSPVDYKLQLGINLTEGLGAGSMPDMGEKAAMESVMAIRQILENNTKMVFITAGMGGGTGTGAAPVIAKIAKELNVLTVGIVTLPFEDEGPQRINQAREGLEKLKPHVDALISISNDRIVDMYGDLTITQAFSKADDILCTAARGIAEIITKPGQINVDFMDVQTAVSNSGRAILGTGIASGANRAEDAVRTALDSPLLDNVKIRGAKHLLVNFTYGDKEPVMSEISKVKRYLQEEAGHSAHLKMGITKDDSLTDEISITVIATGFEVSNAIENPNHGQHFQSTQTATAFPGIQQGIWPSEMNQSNTQASVLENKAESTNTTKPLFPAPSAGIPKEYPITNHSPVSPSPIQQSPPAENQGLFNSAFSGGINGYGISNGFNNTESTNISTSNSLFNESSVSINNQHAMNPVNQVPVPFEALNDLFNDNPLSDIFKENHLEKQRGNRNNVLDDYDVPAYLRKGINLQSAPPSNSQLVSKITIQEENASADRDLTIRPNRHLHDNVD